LIPAPEGEGSQPCLLVNPRSFRASRGALAARAAYLAIDAGLDVHEVVDPATLGLLLDQLRARGQQQIWLLAGDGTIHAIAEYLATLPADDWSPLLLPLAGGRANVVPRECGGYPALPALRRALAARARGHSLTEDRLVTTQVSQPGGAARHGFLLAGGVVQDAVQLCSEHRAAGRSWLHRSWFADPFVLLRIVLQTWLGRRPLPPYAELSISLDGGTPFRARMRLLVASTLTLRTALYNPFAERGQGQLRVSAATATATRFWRNFPAMLRGRFSSSMDQQHGYLSGRCSTAEVLGIDRYALDGETFAADPALPLRIEPGFALRVLRA
jgi:diacylglycerol kinase family enzyme